MKTINLQYPVCKLGLGCRFFANYLRIGRSISILFIPLLAFTLSSSTEITDLVVVSSIVVLGIAGTYSYNCLKDAREDRENSSHPNPLKESMPNILEKNMPYLLFISAILTALFFVSLHSFLLFMTLALFSVVYSKFRIKKIFLVKTLSVSLCYVTLFLACFLAFSPTAYFQAFPSGILIFMLLFNYSIISDIRDLDVDRKHNFITIPVKYGYFKSELIITSIFISLNLLLTLFYTQHMLPTEIATAFLMFTPVETYLIYHIHTKNLKDIDITREITFILIGTFLLTSNLA